MATAKMITDKNPRRRRRRRRNPKKNLSSNAKLALGVAALAVGSIVIWRIYSGRAMNGRDGRYVWSIEDKGYGPNQFYWKVEEPISGRVSEGYADTYDEARDAITALLVAANSDSSKTVWYYWTVFKSEADREVYTPMIQNSQTRETFALPDEWMQSSAERAARDEIASRGGVPQAGQPQA